MSQIQDKDMAREAANEGGMVKFGCDIFFSHHFFLVLQISSKEAVAWRMDTHIYMHVCIHLNLHVVKVISYSRDLIKSLKWLNKTETCLKLFTKQPSI